MGPRINPARAPHRAHIPTLSPLTHLVRPGQRLERALVQDAAPRVDARTAAFAALRFPLLARGQVLPPRLQRVRVAGQLLLVRQVRVRGEEGGQGGLGGWWGGGRRRRRRRRRHRVSLHEREAPLLDDGTRTRAGGGRGRCRPRSRAQPQSLRGGVGNRKRGCGPRLFFVSVSRRPRTPTHGRLHTPLAQARPMRCRFVSAGAARP
jgi:hypothetical protein